MTDSHTVVKALTEVDPGFLALTHTLFGPDVDGAAVWEYLYGSDGIAKMSPAPPDLSTPSGRTKIKVKPKSSTQTATTTTAAPKPPKAVPATKNTAPKSAMGVREPKKSSVMGKADTDRIAEVATHAVFAGVPLERVEEIIKGKKKAAKKAVKAAKKATLGQKAKKQAPGAATGLAAGGAGGYIAGEANDSRPQITYEMPAQSGSLSYYRKSDGDDIEWAGEFTKVDTDQRLAFGWASVISINGEDVVDRQGDLIDWEELEKAAYAYVTDSRKGGNMHKRTWGPDGDQPHHVADVVESFVVTPEKIEKMGLPDTTPVGWWLGMRINDDESWEQVKKGERAGFSIHGRGRRRVMEEV